MRAFFMNVVVRFSRRHHPVHVYDTRPYYTPYTVRDTKWRAARRGTRFSPCPRFVRPVFATSGGGGYYQISFADVVRSVLRATPATEYIRVYRHTCADIERLNLVGWNEFVGNEGEANTTSLKNVLSRVSRWKNEKVGRALSQ